MDKFLLDFLKALDAVGLSFLTPLYNIAWRSGEVTLKWQTKVVVPIFQKGGPECVLQLSGDHTPQPPRKGLCQGAGKESLSID